MYDWLGNITIEILHCFGSLMSDVEQWAYYTIWDGGMHHLQCVYKKVYPNLVTSYENIITPETLKCNSL